MMNKTRNTLLIATLVLVWAPAGLGQSTDAVPQGPVSPVQGIQMDGLSTNEVEYKSPEGEFQVVFPAGCSRLPAKTNRTDRVPVDPDEADLIELYIVTCDRYQETGEGCSAAAYFKVKGDDGTGPGPEFVLDRVKDVLEGFGADILRQRPIKKDFGERGVAEGMEVLGLAGNKIGEIWIRGMIFKDKIYVLTAWNDQGGLFKDPDYQKFFGSFLPWYE